MDNPPDPSDGLAALAEFFVGEGTLGDSLTRVAELARRTSGADMAGITLLVEGRPRTGVFTDPEAPEIDQAQYDVGTGPCVEAFRDNQIYRIASTAEEDRWPVFCQVAAEHGIVTTLSLPVVARTETLGALNLYSRRAGCFDRHPDVTLQAFVHQAAIVLANAQVYWDARELSENLAEAMRSRATIDQAIGIIMSGGGRSPEEAFQILVRASQRENRKLREIAEAMVGQAQQRRPPLSI